MNRRSRLAAALVLLAVTLGCDPGGSEVAGSKVSSEPGLRANPAQGPAAFADPASCAGCHATQQAAWSGSHHDLAMQPATGETVLADFDDAAFTHFGRTTRFRREGERFIVVTEGADGVVAEFDVAYTFGVAPLQQYLLVFPGGRLQSLTIAWDTQRERWFSLVPDESLAHDDPLHWTGPLQRWNTMCAECHSTALDRGYDLSSDSYRTERVALDVSCQACHGPAAAHVDWAASLTPGGVLLDDTDRRLPVGLAAGSAKAELEVCAPCHSRRHRVSERAVIGEPFLDHYSLELLRPDLYHPDGQIDGEVYVYGSFVQSLMHRRGVRCSDCHEPHGLTLRAAGNDLCTRCHTAEPDPRFPTLARRVYDAPEHHFHVPGSPGAACVACHMPQKTYMQVDPRRDHSLRVPRPDLSVSIGTPNPCSGCHSDREAQWAADFLASRRSGEALPGDHYGEAIAAARKGSGAALAGLRKLAQAAEEPAIARATAIAMLAELAADPEIASLLAAAAEEPDPLLRVAAARALEAVDPSRSVAVLARLVEDGRRAVRVEAAQVLSGLPQGELSREQHDAFGRALDEYRAAQRALGDTPEAHLNLGILANRRASPAAAESAYRTAIRMQPEFVPARVNLANLLNAQGRNDEAEAQLREALASARRLGGADRAEPRSRAARGEIHYSLALLLAETDRLEDAASELGEAARLLSARPRVHYNHGLVLQRLERRQAAEAALLRAEALAPRDGDFQNALAIFYAQRGSKELAQRHARRWVDLTGGAAPARRLLEKIEAMPAAP